MRNYRITNDLEIKLSNVLFCTTSNIDYSMARIILCEKLPDLKWGEYVLINGGHCSCYGFDETSWDATVYTASELIKLAESNSINKELKDFILYYFNLK